MLEYILTYIKEIHERLYGTHSNKSAIYDSNHVFQVLSFKEVAYTECTIFPNIHMQQKNILVHNQLLEL